MFASCLPIPVMMLHFLRALKKTLIDPRHCERTDLVTVVLAASRFSDGTRLRFYTEISNTQLKALDFAFVVLLWHRGAFGLWSKEGMYYVASAT